MTPDEVREQLFMVGRELSKAASAIEQLEVIAERSELIAQSEMDKTYLTNEGSIEDREAFAREKSLKVRDEAIVDRASFNRAKMKAKHLELEQMRLMAILKSIQAEGA